jgi:hypothetical protein
MKIENLELIKEKLNKKLSPVTCPMCKAQKGFTPFSNEFQQISYKREGDQLDINDIQYTSTVLCRCNNCGYLAMFDINKLLE